MPRRAMVMSAGFGTRMGALTSDRPKPMLEVAGRPLVDHALDRLAGAGVAEAVVNLHYLGDMIRAHLAARVRPLLRFSEETPKLLDTGGGVAQALPLLGPGPFFTMNPDALWLGSCPLRRLAEAWDASAADALMLLVRREATIAHGGPGDFFLEGNVPVRRGKATEAPFVYTGLQILTPQAVAEAGGGVYSLNRVWDRLIAAGRLRAAVHEGSWVDVGTPEGLAAAEEALSVEGSS